MAALVEGVPGYGVQERIPIHHAEVDLGPELRSRPGLAADDGADMGLMDTDNAVLNLVGPALKHLELLQVDGLDDPILPLKLMAEREGPKTIQLFCDCSEVPPQVLELRPYPFPDRLS